MIFRREAKLFILQVGHQVIRTTGEHPFYVQGIGWRQAKELAEGNLLRSHDGTWTAVEELTETGELQTVYNLRVAEYHTYFVGEKEWGFNVWPQCVLPREERQATTTSGACSGP